MITVLSCAYISLLSTDRHCLYYPFVCLLKCVCVHKRRSGNFSSSQQIFPRILAEMKRSFSSLLISCSCLLLGIFVHSLIMEKICYQIPSSLTVYGRFMLYCNILIIYNTCSLQLFVEFPISLSPLLLLRRWHSRNSGRYRFKVNYRKVRVDFNQRS